MATESVNQRVKQQALRSPHRPSVGVPLTGLVSLLTLLALELVRSSGPLLDMAYTHGGVTGAAAASLLTYGAPGVVAGLVLLSSRRGSPGGAARVLLISTSFLGLMRLVVQGLEGDARFVVGLTTVAVAIGVLTLAVAILASRPGGGRAAAGALAAGAAAGVGLQLALGTWDAYWRHTLLGWVVTVAMLACLVCLALLACRDPASLPTRPARRVWVLGPLLALAAMMLANPAFAASQSGAPLALAGPVTAVGLLVAGGTLQSTGRHAHPGSATGAELAWWSEPLLLVLLMAAMLGVAGSAVPNGVLVLLALLGTQVTAFRVLGRALEPAADPANDLEPGAGGDMLTHGVAGSACLVGLGTILPLLIYQIDYDVPLGFPNELVLVATAALIGAAGLRRTRHPAQGEIGSADSVTLPLLAAGGALVLVGSLVTGAAWVTNPRTGFGAPSTASGPGTGVVVSWNLHYAVNPAGSLDLEAIARTIEAQNPDAVLLQEVSRGWVMGGGVDLATWLSNRLGQEFVFAPAADRQFGNVVMSDRGLQDVEVVDLPYGAGPQNRSAISALVRVGGTEITVTSVHLQSKPDTSTRLRQLETLLGEIGPDASPAALRVVGGDFNAEPGWPEIAVMTGAGFVSAVDEAGDPAALTSPSVDPRRRIDWVFGRGVDFSVALVPRDARSADHLPVIVTVAPKP